ncbi:hypothetical protein PM082_017378 [Marasmius tenuissimus]|nr:hypothetical protein PM082_017378 [Marasmius tenuissimus]
MHGFRLSPLLLCRDSLRTGPVIDYSSTSIVLRLITSSSHGTVPRFSRKKGSTPVSAAPDDLTLTRIISPPCARNHSHTLSRSVDVRDNEDPFPMILSVNAVVSHRSCQIASGMGRVPPVNFNPYSG